MRIAVVGAGAMGRGIAQVSAAAGHEVVLHDAVDGVADAAVERIGDGLAATVARGKLDEDEAEAALRRIQPVSSLDQLSGVEVVIEAVIENLDVKQRLFAELERVVPAECILASNTSSLAIGVIAAGLREPARLVGLHFFNPVPAMKLVEIVLRPGTSDAVRSGAIDFVAGLGKTGIVVADSPGFLVNLAGRAYVTEALALVQENVATVDQVDRIARDTLGFPLGPFELMDLTGVDVNYPVTANLFEHNFGDPRLRSTWYHRHLLETGALGRKAGVGFYRYDTASPGEPSESQPSEVVTSPGAAPRVAVADDVLADLVDSTGLDVVDDAVDADLVLVAPWGADVSTTCAQRGLDPRRAVGVDCVIDRPGRLTLMVPPGVDAAAVDGLRGVLEQLAPVEVVNDSPGFVAQRLLAAVVNLGCEIAQRGVAAPADIDTAVTLGLRYPRGPLAWADEVGIDRVVAVLEGMRDCTGDARYQPSSWLLRRARARLSLLTEDHLPAVSRTLRPTA